MYTGRKFTHPLDWIGGRDAPLPDRIEARSRTAELVCLVLILALIGAVYGVWQWASRWRQAYATAVAARSVIEYEPLSEADPAAGDTAPGKGSRGLSRLKGWRSRH
jgi:hypothetical protein